MLSIDSVDLRAFISGFVIGLIPLALLLLMLAARNRSDNRAARAVRAERPATLPANLAYRHPDLSDEYGRPY